MTALTGLLDELDLSDQELADAMRDAAARTSHDGVGPLTAGMADFLTRTTPRGGTKTTSRKVARILSDRAYAEQVTAQHEAVRAACDLARSLSTRQVATLLGRATTTITRAAGRSLYAYSEGRSLRFPTWQFHDGHPLPGLATVLPALREGLAAATVEAWMTTADPELLDGMAPRQWLIAGGDPAEVVQRLSDADHR
ncbi:hypothetical protein E4J66_04095 [Actinomyces viscosus]|uniref:Uncharacterized protein n=1 Tax=Actinomyces viscosus TaxID=1656 RepID=A0A3S4VYR4_ACTVI|nr:hypothetical protein [Actinomyces viscosus]TFH53296.1 hypothetical protein E4J66_04095 [Actinomyces viscosus]VEI18077.1 Uncharacterised protein [Actinomyces viscosus]